VGAVDNRILAKLAIGCAVVQGLWATTARRRMVCGRVRVVVHSPAASTGRAVCTACAMSARRARCRAGVR